MGRCAAETHKTLLREPLRKRMEKTMLCIKFIAGCGARQLPQQWMGAGYIPVYKFLPFLHHLSSFFQAADAGMTNMQKPLRRRNNADLIPRLRAWTELKKQSIQHSSTWDNSGDGIRPQTLPAPLGGTRPWWLLHPNRGGMQGDGACLIQTWTNPSRILPSQNPLLEMQWGTTHSIADRNTATQGVAAQDRHPSLTPVREPESAPTAPAGELSSTWGSPEKRAEVFSGPWQSSDPWQIPSNLERTQVMPLHGITTHLGSSCPQVSPPGPGRKPSRKHCHRQLWLFSEGINSPPVTLLSVRKRGARCGGTAELWLGSSTFWLFSVQRTWEDGGCEKESPHCHPFGCSELQPECTVCGEQKHSAAGRAGLEQKRPDH